MGLLSKTFAELLRARTTTERVYLISPLLLGALKDIADVVGLSARRDKQIARRMAEQVYAHNRTSFISDSAPLIVRDGPFNGIRYLSFSAGSLLGAKILGTYEMEIGPWFSDVIVAQEHDIFIDVGSAEGYYAVGLAKRCPSLTVYAFDINPAAQAMVKQLAELNDVGTRVKVGGICTAHTLEEILKTAKRPLILMDIEGAEDDLLDPNASPSLKRADVIVELHEHKRPGLTYRILERFADTHKIDAVAAVPDQWKLSLMPRSESDEISSQIREGRRLPQLWLRMKAQSIQ